MAGGGCDGVGGVSELFPSPFILRFRKPFPAHTEAQALGVLQGRTKSSPRTQQIFPREALRGASGAGHLQNQKMRSRLSLMTQQLLLSDLRLDGRPGGGSSQPRQQDPDRAELREEAPVRAEGGS